MDATQLFVEIRILRGDGTLVAKHYGLATDALSTNWARDGGVIGNGQCLLGYDYRPALGDPLK